MNLALSGAKQCLLSIALTRERQLTCSAEIVASSPFISLDLTLLVTVLMLGAYTLRLGTLLR